MNQPIISKYHLFKTAILVLTCGFILAVGIIGMGRMAKARKPPAVKKPNRNILSVETIPLQNETVSLCVTGYGEACPAV